VTSVLAAISDRDALASVAVRKIVAQSEDVHAEGGRPLDSPLRRAVACAVIRNPWAGRGFVDDLWDEMNRVGAVLSQALGTRLVALMGGSDALLGFGKCAVVGVAGDIEHGSGIIHGPAFGPPFRDMVEGSSPIPFIECRSTAGVTVSIPTGHKTARATRAFYQGVDFGLADAPHPDEIAIAIAVVSGPRPHARIGDLTTDAEWAARAAGDGRS
jgi:hypothetical protein